METLNARVATRRRWLLVFALLGGGCAAEERDPGNSPLLAVCEPNCSPQAPASAGSTSAFLAPADDDWRSLVQGRWRLEPGTEGWRCVRTTVDQDVSLHEFRALSPVGTHHTLLSVNDSPDAPDGITECEGGTNASRIVFGAGVGTDDFAFPEGVAFPLRAGQQLLLNLHLFNASDAPLEGSSGILVRTLEAGEADTQAEVVLAGPDVLNIPPGRVVQGATCPIDHELTLFALLPHMHRFGRHATAIAHTRSGGDIELHDAAYDFDSQHIYPLDPLEMSAGDSIDVRCTYENDSDAPVHWGNSSLAEMCFVTLFRYPAEPQSEFTCP